MISAEVASLSKMLEEKEAAGAIGVLKNPLVRVV